MVSNHLLDVANNLRKEYKAQPSDEIAKILYTKRGLRDQIPSLKETHPFLKTVYSSVLKNAALRLSRSIKDYQDSRKGKRKRPTGWQAFVHGNKDGSHLSMKNPGKVFPYRGRL